MVGLLAGYLAFNLGFFRPGRRVFLGDSGSMVVGLVLLILLVELSQKNNPVITRTSAG
jgi:UDP-N-acetylmuramyl pentapeptide phosphotransferase/UDP-N-acetylglucosamine-1-phosphate transferase